MEQKFNQPQRKYSIALEKDSHPTQKQEPDLAFSVHISQIFHYSSARIIVQAIITCLGSLYFGYAMGELNMAQPKLNQAYNIAEENLDSYIGILNGVMPLGASIGCLLTGQLLKSKGRRTIILLADLIGISSCLLFLIANFWVATVARFIMGLVVGANSTIIPLYVRETSPLKLFQKTEILNQGFLSTGICLAYLIGLGFPIDEDELEEQSGFYWRFNLLFPIIPLLIRALCFIFVYKDDTIIYYLQIEDDDKAKHIITQYYEPKSYEQVYHSYKNEVDAKKKQDNSWAFIFTKVYIKRTLIGCFIFIFLQFSGINAIVFYSNQIFEETLGSKKTANNMTVVCGLEMAILGFLSNKVSKRFGRKKIYCVGLFLLCLVNIFAGIISYITKDQDEIETLPGVLLIACIFLYNFIFSFSIGPLSWVYSAEINSNENAVGLATCVNWLCSFIIGLIFPTLTTELGIYSVFWIFAGFCIFGVFFFKIYSKETLGVPAEKVIEMFTKDQNKQQKEYVNNIEYNNESKQIQNS